MVQTTTFYALNQISNIVDVKKRNSEYLSFSIYSSGHLCIKLVWNLGKPNKYDYFKIEKPNKYQYPFNLAINKTYNTDKILSIFCNNKN